MSVGIRSRYLTRLQRRGLIKLGDVYFPRVDDLPSFSECGCAEHVDGAFEHLPADDRASLKVLLTIVGASPCCVARRLVAITERGLTMQGRIGAALRFIRLGVKGIVASLYYSGEVGRDYRGRSPLEILGYQVSVYTEDIASRCDGSVAACAGLEPSYPRKQCPSPR